MTKIHHLAIVDCFDNGYEEWIVCECKDDNIDYEIKSLPSLQKANEWIDRNYFKLDNKYSKNPEDYGAYTKKGEQNDKH